MTLLDRLLRRKQQAPRMEPFQDTDVFITDGGRHHLARIPYLLPIDHLENNRLDFQHYFLRSLLHTNFFAPLDPGTVRHVLDIGSGTGRWVNEMAQEFPQAQIIGLDIHPRALPGVANLANTLFLQGDVLKRLPFEHERFDLTHQRLLVAAIPSHCWLRVVQEMKRVTRDGGWIELLEGGTTFVNAGPATTQFLAWWDHISQQQGIDASLMGKLDTLLVRAGLHRIEKRVVSAPLGSWAGHTGTMLATNTLTGWSGLKDHCISQGGVKPELFDATMASLLNEWNQRRVRYDYYITWGQVQHGK